MLTAIKAGFERWLDRRIPASDNITLHHRQTFVLPSQYGYLMLAILILMLIAAINYQNSMAFLLTFTLGALGFNVIIQTYRNLTGLTLSSRGAEATFAGQPLRIPIVVSTTKDSDHYAIGFGTSERVQEVIDVSPGERVETFIQVLPEKRGLYSPARFYTVTSYPLGLLRVWSWFKFRRQYLVYPTPVKPGVMPLADDGKPEQEKGKVNTGNEDFFGIRSYRKGDARQKIHWRAYAREQGLHTMEFVEPEAHTAILDFDAFTEHDTELRLSWLCHLVLQAEASNERYGLKLPGTIIEPAHGATHCQKCLRALALFDEGAVS